MRHVLLHIFVAGIQVGADIVDCASGVFECCLNQGVALLIVCWIPLPLRLFWGNSELLSLNIVESDLIWIVHEARAVHLADMPP